jgi:ubiquinone/menaquinone biosynthesis C-methylase UbiE
MNLATKFINHWRLAGGYNPKKYWNKQGKGYFKQHPPIGERGESMLINTLVALKFTSLVDIGCGYGRYLKVIANKFPSVQLIGTDISSTQINEAKKYLLEYSQISLFETDGIKMPFKDKVIDISFTLGCIMHVPPYMLNSFFAEVIRITKDKGLFYESSFIRRPLSRFLTPSVVWYSHNYDKLFNRFSLPYKIIAETKQKNIVERFYLVDFAAHK